MSLSDRLRQFAVRGCLIAGVVLLAGGVGPCQSEEPPERPRQTGAANGGAATVQTQTKSIATVATKSLEPENLSRIATALESISTKTESDEEKDRATRDVNAQEWMAIWACLMFLAAVVQAGASIVGIYYIRKTLDAARQLSASENRGWIKIVRITLMGDPKFHGNDCDVPLKIIIKNVGRTPVHNVIFKPIGVVANESERATAGRISTIRSDYKRTVGAVTRTIFPDETCELTGTTSVAKNLDRVLDIVKQDPVFDRVAAIHAIVLYKIVGDDDPRETIRSFYVAGVDLVQGRVLRGAKVQMIDSRERHQSTT